MANIKVITLCGSTKFIKEFKETEAYLTRKGAAVISPAFFEQRIGIIPPAEAELFGKIHFKKIVIADEIFVIDVHGYLGESTKKEIAYAKSLNKIVKYYSQEQTN